MSNPGERPLDYRGQAVVTLRQIDRHNGAAKGTAFRAFKHADIPLVEGRDFFVVPLDRPSDPATESLLLRARQTNAVYSSSRALILLTRHAYARLAAAANLSPL
ncbi:hypothetical protein GJ672_01575 [Spiribacter sp. 2438]|uniref:hypothetical protein n=1 Tax=Spiribacter sp. 2438 TaxID=2666185 RepID=UPI0012AFF524|nr:hypothetical protein [Spiribacter sp. 2438]QGM21095.1 hypothetical protein GJ672_01575 [Spiribacter sp. 2438]